ncbi:ubiquinone/menaquinone biosynthesis methyltransferase [Galdieria sulphuraria]|uniref:2-methoxy-6-polyprenyl-1,4-benzoquinol methylase, mitochondrial n=1 Tax=Galdieria sulphuraria TaxID=130081 RepID=M2Y054_GALSU|nr:ubiquinone/menaquinone biosynthesis methyltransferase [Galdieria sulphuraria]EME29219.1 ubiquinone/menaquinone biosynthesis methyltransferase [Galdieria sulphuraria]|eukprot:XP_005705739.1 ubiquinone/menaquinone biosynthesis methyltransferase [Galdieria sulphuraria]
MSLISFNKRHIVSVMNNIWRQYRGISFSACALDSFSDYTHFGYRSVPKNAKTSMVGSVFSDVASKYDLMNDLMSFGLHRLWKDLFVMSLAPTADMRILDVAGGTGDIAFRIVEKKRKEEHYNKKLLEHGVEPVVVVDINEDMLQVGKERAKLRGYSESEVMFVHGNAEKLPAASETVDAYVISFGMRNVTEPEAALVEAFRVLRPGGKFHMLEFAKVQNDVLQYLYDMYSFSVIPLIGQIVANNRDAYQYLVESIRKFPSQEEFAKLMIRAGFQQVSYRQFHQGIVAQYSGFKL